MRGKLKNKRLQMGFSDVEKLSKVVGISSSYYYKIEQGKRTPGINLAKRIADTLDHNVEDLFFNNNLDDTSNIDCCN